LEIAPGYGRWTKFLVPACDNYLGIDLSEACVVECRKRFEAASHARFIKNNGRSLQAAPDNSFDLIFSFDSLVHVERDVLEEDYIPQMLRKLAPGGAAFIHHSNLLALIGRGGELPGISEGARARTVSAAVVWDLVEVAGGQVLLQEVIDWVDTGQIDAMTVFGRAKDFPGQASVYLTNRRFMEEAAMIREFHSPYGRLLPQRPPKL
jgi:SAM-dependent methyltransferase